MSENKDAQYMEEFLEKFGHIHAPYALTIYSECRKASEEEIEMYKRIVNELELKYGASRKREESLKKELEDLRGKSGGK